MNWMIYSFIALLSFAAVGILYKIIRVSSLELYFLISIISGAILGAILGIQGKEIEIEELNTIILLVLLGVFMTIGQVFGIKAIKAFERNPGIVVFLMNLNFILVYILSIFIFGVRPSFKELIGVMLAVLSFFLMTM